jgi:hypothetical protein
VTAFLVLMLLAPGTSHARKPESGHWSYQPIGRPVPPAFGKMDSAIDAFVRQRLRQEDIAPSPPAGRATQIRRVTLDLLGLPPTPQEVDAFLTDDRPDAYQRLVDRLLASPRYGERWARPWLDLCHYADTDGYLTDQLRPVAWRYRHWLIGALNANMPFDQFTVEQLAGDLLPGATQDQRIATGFLRQTLSNREGGADIEEFRVFQVLDRVSMVGTTWLGLTVGCARCHDHKYDAVSQQEFYQFYAYFNNADEANFDAPLPGDVAAYRADRAVYERQRRQLLAPHREAVEQFQRRWEAKMLHAWKHPSEDHVWDRQWELLGLVWGGGLGEGQLEGTEICKLPWEKRSGRQKDDLMDYFLPRASIVDPEKYKQLELGSLKSKLDELKKQFPAVSRAPAMQAAVNHRQTFVHERGEFRDRGEDVEPAGLACLPGIPTGEEDSRLSLARWLVSSPNPLTARVVVNRLWQEFFGTGLVDTPEDFGTRGSLPSHPRLLDWLAGQFIDSGWDVKQIQRLIVTSATYRQSSRPRPELAERDPYNRLLYCQRSLRIPGEAVRDVALAASGLLSTKMGGPSVKPPQSQSVIKEAFGSNPWDVSDGEDRYRRAVYTFILRTTPYALTATFDAPSPQEPCARRDRSNTPLQALTLLNDPAFFDMAQALAQRVLAEPAASDRERLVRAFRLCLGRQPLVEEVDQLEKYLQAQRRLLGDHPEQAQAMVTFDSGTVPVVEAAAWSSTCSILLNLHEFITRD